MTVHSREGLASGCATGLPMNEAVPSSPAVGIPDAVHLKQLLDLLCKGHWAASVYHAPPNRKYPRGGIMCATTIRLKGEFRDQETALKAAEQAVSMGRVSIGTFIHGPSAKPYARFVLDSGHVEQMALIAQGIETQSAATECGPKGESPVPQECAEKETPNDRNS